MTEATTLFKSTSFLRAKRDLLLSLKKAKEQMTSVKKSSSELSKTIAQEIAQVRGRPLFYPAIFSGLGNGPLTELIDGSVKFDFITGIGTHFFGHSDLDLISTAIEAASKNVFMHGNLQSSLEVKEFLETLLTHAGGNLKYGWLSTSGTDANETALKVIRQKKSPAHKVIAFKNCFHGRTLIMADITDQKSYKKGLTDYNTAFYIPFFDENDPKSLENSKKALREILSQHKSEVCAFVCELVQGEGGFTPAPKEFFVELFNICREEKIAIWIDEIQTVGRTGELFAFQKLGLSEYVDVVTVGKMLQNCATLYTEAYNPEPGLLAGTFAGTTVSLAVGKRILDRMKEEKFFGKNGKISKLEKWVKSGLLDLQKKVGSDTVSHISGVGAMWAFQYKDGSQETTKAFILKAFEEGVMLFYCGRGPYKIRFLLPAGILEEDDYLKALRILERIMKKG